MRASRLATLGLALGAIAWQAPAQAADSTPPLSAASLYNVGNAYARAGKPGLAVLNYERARLLTPDDPDLAANLATVRRSAHVATTTPGAVAAPGAANAFNGGILTLQPQQNGIVTGTIATIDGSDYHPDTQLGCTIGAAGCVENGVAPKTTSAVQ